METDDTDFDLTCPHCGEAVEAFEVFTLENRCPACGAYSDDDEWDEASSQ